MWLRLLRGILLAIALPGCSCATEVHVRGSLRGSVTFEIGGLKPLQSLAIDTRDFSGGWHEVWRVNGRSDGREVSYGHVPAGMVAGGPAEPLRRHGVYVAHAATQGSWLGPASCPGDVLFVIDDADRVRPCPDLAACTRLAGVSGDAAQ